MSMRMIELNDLWGRPIYVRPDEIAVIAEYHPACAVDGTGNKRVGCAVITSGGYTLEVSTPSVVVLGMLATEPTHRRALDSPAAKLDPRMVAQGKAMQDELDQKLRA